MRGRLSSLAAAMLGLAFLSGLSAAADDAFAWKPRHDRWEPADERSYEQFVAAIATADCRTVPDCLGPEHNPLAAGDPPGLSFGADCADLVYMLRAYFAWKHGLPFGFVNQVEARQGAGDLRYSPGGNRPSGRWDVSVDGSHPDIREVFQAIRDTVSTATFRMDPRIEHPVLQDFYSPAITREGLRPGSAIYNGDGHVVIVSLVDDKGRIHFVDAHPDGSVTRGVYAGQFLTGDPATGAGFHAWRPVRHDRGRLVLAENAQIPDFSMEQYFGPDAGQDWSTADFSEGGRNHDFLEFVRRRLAKGRLVYDIVEEAQLAMDGLCDALSERERYVGDAVSAGLPLRRRPGRLSGVTQEEQAEWFAYSTPGRDRRLRKQLAGVQAMLARLITLYHQGDRSVRYRGFSLRGALRRTVRERAERCHVAYRSSDGVPVTLSLREVLLRLPNLSFDPYHCVERRWGASGAELTRCDDDGLKARWYEAQHALRDTESFPISGNPTLEELEAATRSYVRRPGTQFEEIIEQAPNRRPRRAR